MKKFGSTKITDSFNISQEYKELSLQDKASAQYLAQGGFYRQACYFLVQAIEKTIRAKIFTLVNPQHKYYRDINKNHSILDAVNLLIEIISRGDNYLKASHHENIKKHVLFELNYQQIHNNLRYPWYSERFNNYNTLDVKLIDYNNLLKILNSLENYLKDLH